MVAPVPEIPSRGYDFSAFSVGQPGAPLPGNQVDNELDRANTAVEQTIDFVRQAINDDGTVKTSALTSIVGTTRHSGRQAPRPLVAVALQT